MQPQTDPLNERDFEVFWRSVDNVRGFGFYNCGANAGPRCDAVTLCTPEETV